MGSIADAMSRFAEPRIRPENIHDGLSQCQKIPLWRFLARVGGSANLLTQQHLAPPAQLWPGLRSCT